MIKLSHSARIALNLTLATLISLTVKAQTIAAASINTDSVVEIHSTKWLNNLEPQLLAQQQQSRTALVIGNADYGPDDSLEGPTNDAQSIYDQLQDMGFDVPPPLINANKQEIEAALRDFSQRMRPGGVNVFYYSGHGVQIDGVNYLIPVELSETSSEVDVQYNAVRLDYIVAQMFSVVHEFNFLIIDACRNNPFYERWGRPKGPGSQGLTSTRPPRGTMIAYAAEENEVAIDGRNGSNSPFTASLLNYLGRSGLPIYQLLHEVQQEVETVTDGDQIPSWEGYPRSYDIALNPSDLTASLPTSLESQLVPQPAPEPEPETPPTITIAPPAPTIEPSLVSTVTGVDYQPLRDALAAGDFRLADQTTRSLILRAADEETLGFLGKDDIRNFTCEDLKIIDQLWLEHSAGKFGFSVQQNIYQSLGGTSDFNADIWDNFGDQVEWRVRGSWLRYHQFSFSETAVAGHLPRLGVGGERWINWGFDFGKAGDGFAFFSHRAADCGI